MINQLDPRVFADAFANALIMAQSRNTFGTGVKQVTPGTPTGNLMYGSPVPGVTAGFFGVCGLDQTLINASVGPRGLESLLPAFGTDITNPEFAILTGFEQVGGQSEPSGGCSDCIIGESEGCILTAQFGKICRGTKELSLTEINTRRTPGETRLRMMGSITGPDGSPIPGAGHGTLITNEIEWAAVEAAVMMQRVFQQMIFQGNPTRNVGQGYWEFPGFDILIGTGKVDAHTNVACAAADSDIKNFNYGNVASASGPDIIEVVAMMEAYLYHNASRMGLDPARWILAMRPELWYSLTEVWACRYMTYRCNVNSSATPFVDTGETIKLRDSMRAGMYLMVNGRQLEVVLDDGIFENNNANNANLQPGQFASDIYFIPLSAHGTPVTYFEYQDFRKTLAGVRMENESLNSRVWITDNGRFLVDRTFTGRCFHDNVTMKPRLILRTPQLAGRVQNIMYAPLQHFRSPFDTQITGGTDPYFVKGGTSTRSPGTLYSEWD